MGATVTPARKGTIERMRVCTVYAPAVLTAVLISLFVSFTMTHKKKSLLFAPAGLMTIGFGTCLVQWATSLQQKKVPTAQWVGAGTLALGVFNAGICLFGRGVLESALHEVNKEHKKAQEKVEG